MNKSIKVTAKVWRKLNGLRRKYGYKNNNAVVEEFLSWFEERGGKYK